MTDDKSRTISERLCAWTSAVQYADLPSDVVEKEKLLILDSLGLAIAAAHEGEAKAVAEAAKILGKGSESTVIGTGERLPSTGAAMANAAQIHAFDFDDTHIKAMLHSSCFIVATALAVAEARHATGRDMLTAAAIGHEAIVRLSLASGNAFYQRGLHTAGFFGPLGASLVACKLGGADAQRTAMAFGISCSTGGGLLQGIIDGSDVKMLHPGWAAAGGIIASRLAELGVTGPRQVLEGDMGYYKALARPGIPLDSVVEDLGRRWEIRNIGFKLYPSEHGTHYFMESALYLKKHHGIPLEDITEIRCRVNSVRYHQSFEPYEVKYSPPSAYSARFSLPYLIGARLVLDHVGLGAFSPENLRSPAILSLARKVTRELDGEAVPSLEGLGHVTIRTKDGREYSHRIEALRGTTQNPASKSDIEAKFRANAGMALPERQMQALVDAVEDLENQKDIGNLIKLTVASGHA